MTTRLGHGLAALALLTACTSHGPMAKRGGAPAPVSAAVLSQPVDVAAIDDAIAASAMKGPATLRMLVRRANLRVEVKTLAPAEERVVAITKSLGGYMASQNQIYGGMSEGRTLTVRVPAAQLDAALDSIGRLGRVTYRYLAAEDVTDQVVDLDARVTSLRATRDRLRQLLDRAASVTDVVAVEKELGRVQAELDSLEARLTQMRGQVAMSELTVDLHAKHVLGPAGLALAGVGWILQKLFFIR